MFFRGYITEGVILTLTSFFSMSKLTEEINMVLDTTVRRLNSYLWDKKIMLPSMGSLLIMVGPDTYMVNLDVGYMFYNFRLSPVLENYCGVDLGYYLGNKKEWQVTPLWMLWVRLMMGVMLSTYAAIQDLLWSSEVVKGDRSEPDNPFR